MVCWNLLYNQLSKNIQALEKEMVCNREQLQLEALTARQVSLIELKKFIFFFVLKVKSKSEQIIILYEKNHIYI